MVTKSFSFCLSGKLILKKNCWGEYSWLISFFIQYFKYMMPFPLAFKVPAEIIKYLSSYGVSLVYSMLFFSCCF